MEYFFTWSLLAYGSNYSSQLFIEKSHNQVWKRNIPTPYSLFVARDISLYELEEKFGLQITTDSSFFREWTENLPTLNDAEKQAVERVKSNYLNLNQRRLMSEEAVKMVVLSPLLDLAGFYQPPFEIETGEAPASLPLRSSAVPPLGETPLSDCLTAPVCDSRRSYVALSEAMP